MASNPYYVKGGGDYGRQLSGISNIVSGVREQRRGQAGKAALQEAYKTRDPEAINRVLVDHPELQEQVSKMDELGRMMKKDNILSVALGADQALNIEDAFERQAFLADRKNEVEARGGNASETDFLIGLPYEEQTQALEGLVEVGRNFAGYGGAGGKKGFQFGGQLTAKDSEGNQYFVTSQKDAGRGGTRTVYAPIGNAPDEPVGKLDFTGQFGLTGKETIKHKGDIVTDKETIEADIKAKTEPSIQRDIALSRYEGKSIGEDQELLRSMESSMPRLREVTTNLKSLVNDATFTMAGKAGNEIAKQFGFSTEGGTARVRMEAIADNEVLPLLKQTFGAAFTAEEGNRLRATLVNPDATPEAKMATLEAFIDSKEGQIKSLRAKTSGLPSDVTEEDISFTMNKHGISREEVLQKLR